MKKTLSVALLLATSTLFAKSPGTDLATKAKEMGLKAIPTDKIQ